MSKILIIEDDFDVAKVLKKRLSKSSFETLVAEDGYHGIELAHKEKPDLIILDLKLPAGGGLGVLKGLRSSLHTKHIPVLVLTAMKDEEYKKKTLEKGVDAYLEKPYDPAVLLDTIKNILVK